MFQETITRLRKDRGERLRALMLAAIIGGVGMYDVFVLFTDAH